MEAGGTATGAIEGGRGPDGGRDASSWSQSPRRRALLDAAAAIFLESGYEAASVNSIARRASASKETIYVHYGSKAGLFAAVMEDALGCMAAPFRLPDIRARMPEEVLRFIARQFAATLTQDRAIALCRVAIAEAGRFPELGRAYYEAGPAPAIRLVAAYLEEQVRRGALRLADPGSAAELFVEQVRGVALSRVLFAVEDGRRAPELDAALGLVVHLFLDGCRPHG